MTFVVDKLAASQSPGETQMSSAGGTHLPPATATSWAETQMPRAGVGGTDDRMTAFIIAALFTLSVILCFGTNTNHKEDK